MNPDHLSPRLSLALSLVPRHGAVLDVGSDRGDFAIALERRGQKAYAAENKEGPYRTLCENLQRHRSMVVPLFQDGLTSCPADVVGLTILGMGGRTIERILREGSCRLSPIEWIVISPQSDFSSPIGFLASNGYRNVDGRYVDETRQYPILLFERGREDIDEDELRYGPVPWRRKDPVLGAMLMAQYRRLRELPADIQDLRKAEIESCERRLRRWNLAL